MHRMQVITRFSHIVDDMFRNDLLQVWSVCVCVCVCERERQRQRERERVRERE